MYIRVVEVARIAFAEKFGQWQKLEALTYAIITRYKDFCDLRTFRKDLGKKRLTKIFSPHFCTRPKAANFCPPLYIQRKTTLFLPKFHFVFVQAMKNFLPDQWWFLMHTNNMERRLNETMFLEKVKKTNNNNKIPRKGKKHANTRTTWKEDRTLFLQAEADLRIFASKVTSHQYLIVWQKISRTKKLKNCNSSNS